MKFADQQIEQKYLKRIEADIAFSFSQNARLHIIDQIVFDMNEFQLILDFTSQSNEKKNPLVKCRSFFIDRIIL